ncbi:hypothetical protein CHS0354_018383 [Potamilus streckersoni]|uniref:N-acetyl-D-glucosamine kinase n=1 Tax=Potamilus streckersoni TaxID=2493646 RepID=A0AAE0TAH3_9BIVA|nr:hypothetical protein CHS0354_018383 [Potamilus streckersoni]
MTAPVSMNDLVSLCKQRGFIFPGSEIYGGLANTWDYGPLGAELKNNIKRLWWKDFITNRDDVVGLDSAILMNPRTWEASGHVGGFSDPLMDCRACKTRHRADKLIDEKLKTEGIKRSIEGMDNASLRALITEYKITCPDCGKSDFTDIRAFNLMFKTYQGVTEDSGALVYLRPETAQGIFVNFRNVQSASRKKLPFGIAQIGKSFRNEITPGNFIFRTREFEQMELEFFCFPEDSIEWHGKWKETCRDWLLKIGLKPELFRLREHSAQELSHYSKATTDIEFLFPFGWGELWALPTAHMKFSGKDLHYAEPDRGIKVIPHVIEPSLGVERLLLSVLISAYSRDIADGEERVVLSLSPELAPLQAAVFPLSKKLNENAEKLCTDLRRQFRVEYDDAGSIGRRYRRQDEIGTPFCITSPYAIAIPCSRSAFPSVHLSSICLNASIANPLLTVRRIQSGSHPPTVKNADMSGKLPLSPPEYYIGFDGGGTKCLGKLTDAGGNTIAEVSGGMGNVYVNCAEVTARLTELSYEALSKAGLPREAIKKTRMGAGLGGFEISSAAQQFNSYNNWQFHSLIAVHDGHIAVLGAHGAKDGAVVIIGTGICGYSVRNGIGTKIGGWGIALSDMGSGAWLGREALSYTLRSLDGLEPVTPLSDTLAKEFNNSSEDICLWAKHAGAGQYGKFAPLVCRAVKAEDPLALKLIKASASETELLINKLHADAAPRISLTGGLANEIYPYIQTETRSLLSPALGNPADGALYLARQAYL